MSQPVPNPDPSLEDVPIPPSVSTLFPIEVQDAERDVVIFEHWFESWLKQAMRTNDLEIERLETMNRGYHYTLSNIQERQRNREKGGLSVDDNGLARKPRVLRFQFAGVVPHDPMDDGDVDGMDLENTGSGSGNAAPGGNQGFGSPY